MGGWVVFAETKDQQGLIKIARSKSPLWKKVGAKNKRRGIMLNSCHSVCQSVSSVIFGQSVSVCQLRFSP